jgi:SAM-dependent methyltransferase
MLAAADRAVAVHYAAAEVERLPLATATIDVAFLSMMWHHLRDAEAAVAELTRAVRVGGAVFVRTPTLDLLGRFPFVEFFPESRALDARRMPSRTGLRALFMAAGFSEAAQRTVDQRMSDGPACAPEASRRSSRSPTTRSRGDSRGSRRGARPCRRASRCTSRWTCSSFAGSIPGHGEGDAVADQRAEDHGRPAAGVEKG